MSRPSYIKLHSEAYQKLVAAYEQQLRTLGYTAKGAVGTARYVAAFLAYAEGLGISSIEQITTTHLQGYQRHLQSRPNRNKPGRLSARSVYTNLRAVQQFFNRQLEQGNIVVNPATALQLHYPRSRQERSIVNAEQIRAMYEACESYQERTVLSLAYGCGLRANELERLNEDQVLLREGLLIVAAGKGNKRRVVPMSRGVVSDLVGYYEQERPLLLQAPTAAFMLHSRGGRMRAYTYNKYLQIILSSAVDKGLLSAAILKRGISLHSLRHSIATHLIEQGVSVEQVRQFLGHSQLETTQVYTRISAEQLEKLVQ